jgi:signal peptidase I
MDLLKAHAGEQMATRRSIRAGLASVVTAGVLMFVFHEFVIQIFTVSSDSMSPTLAAGDSVLVDRVAYRRHPPGRGDIIALLSPRAGGREFVKRVVGLQGDTVSEQDGNVFLNGTLVAGNQSSGSVDASSPAGDAPPLRIPAGRLYVLGDNRGTSLDSRFWGTTSERDVVGKALLICWSRGKHWWEVRWSRIGRWLH